MKSVALYSKDSNGSIREWNISCEIMGDGAGVIAISHGVIDGQKTVTTEYIDEGLAGRTIEEQMLSRVDSRINKKLDAGYVRSVEDAIVNRRVNPLGYPRPMTAKPYKQVAKQISYSQGIHIQRKYNGHRCLVKNDNGRNVAYSRNGKLIESIDHIIRDIHIPEGFILDGELYHHGTKLQTISSWIKKKQPETKCLEYVVYDCISDDIFSERIDTLSELSSITKGDAVFLAETIEIFSEDEAQQRLKQFLKEGYEGAMLRISSCGYQDSKRSKSLVKMKKLFDGEFLVVDITSSSHGWGILHCLAKNGKRFSVSAPGDVYEKTKILEEKDKYIGLYAHVEYPELTEAGKPFHGVCLGFRDKGSE